METTFTLSRQISEKDFAVFGLNHVAYIRPVAEAGMIGYSVHAADGTPLTILPDRDVAFAAVRQNDMEPVSVH